MNEPERSLITCNLNRLLELKKKGQQDILTAMLFHEILGIMGLELGHQENVSLYPVSSKIIPYHSIVESTPISEGEIRPEYYGLDNASYGITVTNKKNKESLRMICLNDNVEVHRCRNYSVVRSASGRQAPLVPEVVTLTPSDLQLIKGNLSIALRGGKYSNGNLHKRTWDHVFNILNLGNDLALIGKKDEVTERIYENILYYLTKAVAEKINSVTRAQKAEQDAIQAAQLAWQNRKDKEPLENIGDFSINFKKDFIFVANTDSVKVSSRISNYSTETTDCHMTYSKTSFDRLIPANSVIKSIGIDESPTNEPSTILKFQFGDIPFEIKCMKFKWANGTPYNPTIKVIKDSLGSIINITLDDPVQISSK